MNKMFNFNGMPYIKIRARGGQERAYGRHVSTPSGRVADSPVMH
jgi:hypothetical protein